MPHNNLYTLALLQIMEVNFGNNDKLQFSKDNMITTK